MLLTYYAKLHKNNAHHILRMLVPSNTGSPAESITRAVHTVRTTTMIINKNTTQPSFYIKPLQVLQHIWHSPACAYFDEDLSRAVSD
jgi:hypothetical protein